MFIIELMVPFPPLNYTPFPGWEGWEGCDGIEINFLCEKTIFSCIFLSQRFAPQKISSFLVRKYPRVGFYPDVVQGGGGGAGLRPPFPVLSTGHRFLLCRSDVRPIPCLSPQIADFGCARDLIDLSHAAAGGPATFLPEKGAQGRRRPGELELVEKGVSVMVYGEGGGGPVCICVGVHASVFV